MTVNLRSRDVTSLSNQVAMPNACTVFYVVVMQTGCYPSRTLSKLTYRPQVLHVLWKPSVLRTNSGLKTEGISLSTIWCLGVIYAYLSISTSGYLVFMLWMNIKKTLIRWSRTEVSVLATHGTLWLYLISLTTSESSSWNRKTPRSDSSHRVSNWWSSQQSSYDSVQTPNGVSPM